MNWYDSNKNRFEIEKRLLGQCYPGTKIIIENGKMRLQYRIATGRNSYVVEGIFANNHPYSPMHFFVLQPSLRNSPPHRYPDGRLCLHGAWDIGPQTTAKVYMDWVRDWLTAYEKWLAGGSWPKTNRR